VLGKRRFSLSEAESHPGSLTTSRGEEKTETEEYGNSSFVYRARRPFHAERPSDAIDRDFDEGFLHRVLRSKGWMWIASKIDWSQAGCSVSMTPARYRWASAANDGGQVTA